MGLTNYLNGITSFGVPVLGSGSLTTTGNVWFVHNSDGNDGNTGTDADHPFKTLDYAVGKCTANQGDIIIVMPGSNESVTSTIVVDVAGVSIVGLGHGAARGKITSAMTGATDNVLEISADNILIENIYFKGSTTGTAIHFIMNTGYDDSTIRNCVFEQNTKNLIAIELNSGADYAIIENCDFLGVAAGADSAIRFTVTDYSDSVVA